jgi:hypothetical protein
MPLTSIEDCDFDHAAADSRNVVRSWVPAAVTPVRTRDEFAAVLGERAPEVVRCLATGKLVLAGLTVLTLASNRWAPIRAYNMYMVDCADPAGLIRAVSAELKSEAWRVHDAVIFRVMRADASGVIIVLHLCAFETYEQVADAASIISSYGVVWTGKQLLLTEGGRYALETGNVRYEPNRHRDSPAHLCAALAGGFGLDVGAPVERDAAGVVRLSHLVFRGPVVRLLDGDRETSGDFTDGPEAVIDRAPADVNFAATVRAGSCIPVAFVANSADRDVMAATADCHAPSVLLRALQSGDRQRLEFLVGPSIAAGIAEAAARRTPVDLAFCTQQVKLLGFSEQCVKFQLPFVVLTPFSWPRRHYLWPWTPLRRAEPRRV